MKIKLFSWRQESFVCSAKLMRLRPSFSELHSNSVWKFTIRKDVWLVVYELNTVFFFFGFLRDFFLREYCGKKEAGRHSVTQETPTRQIVWEKFRPPCHFKQHFSFIFRNTSVSLSVLTRSPRTIHS